MPGEWKSRRPEVDEPTRQGAGGAIAHSIFIEEPGRRTWSSMCVLCKESDGRLHQLTLGTLRSRPASMQMRNLLDQWRAQGRAQSARSRFPLCDSGGRHGCSGATGTSGSGRLRRRPSAPSDGPSKGQTRGWTWRSGEWRGAGRWRGTGRWRGPGLPWYSYVTGGSENWSWGPEPGVADCANGCISAECRWDCAVTLFQAHFAAPISQVRH